MDWLLETQGFGLLSKGIDASFSRHNMLANNISNVNTPNFKRSDVRFSDIFSDFVEKRNIRGTVTDSRHIQIGTPDKMENLQHQEFKDDRHSSRNDGNNVDVEFEMAQLVKNSMYTQTLLTLMSGKMQKIRIAMKGA
ncbi:flagellar basal body rod protein FlgB [bacterium]|nr:flagellar basal body rod protein FlgB [bacterium]